MMFRPPWWLIGAGMSLETMRRCFIGGTSLALFIDLTGLDQFSCLRDASLLRAYLPIEAALIHQIPPIIRFITFPFIDYHNAAKCFLSITDALCYAKQELLCQPIWEKQDTQP